ncbi:universal stress protein [Fervidibacillus halotolerans]|uniref:Universal stress protein n=1 Tax=Fervidibacillus halotolerans TaxID=2980027 RepID=A0A9E8S039_9BACI|nr:universal stress protein [Fervidibacillus halotolerans]WAA12242.1 universal stress protein [Fervidibacillus halotolerans]
MKNTILVPVDDSSHSYRALDFAIKLAECNNFSIAILNVQPNIHTPSTERFLLKEEVDTYLKEMGMEVLNRAKEYIKERNVEIKVFIRIGSPKIEIIKLANELNACCIVIGSRGLGPLKGAVLGSVSYGVLHDAPCPVTIVP